MGVTIRGRNSEGSRNTKKKLYITSKKKKLVKTKKERHTKQTQQKNSNNLKNKEKLNSSILEKQKQLEELMNKVLDEEMKKLPMFDYVVVNEEGALDRTVDVLESIIQAERWRFPRRILNL